MTWIEAIAVVAGLLCVALTIRQNIWCWPTGLVQVALYIFIFYQVKLYSDLILHVIYVVLQIYGWHHWLHGGKDRRQIAVSRLTPKANVAWLIVTVCASVTWGYAMATFTDAAAPYGDAFIIGASLVAQWLMTRKHSESWYYWLVVDIIAIVVFLYKSLYLTAALYLVFFVLAIIGLITWRKSLIQISQSEISNENRPHPREIRAPAQRTSAVN
jgi:nicotinamide mononucleotide transporter